MLIEDKCGNDMGKISVLNFSGIYEDESFFEDRDCVAFIDMKDLQGTNCMCDDAAKEEVLGRIGDITADCDDGGAPGVDEHVSGDIPYGLHFIDSGNYHYVSALYLSMVKEPFSLVVLDHHPDMQRPMFDILSCGGWVLEVLEKNEYVRDVHIIGADRGLINELDEAEREKVRFYDLNEIWSERKHLGLSGEDSDEGTGIDDIIVNLPKTEYPIYLSVDKDVIARAQLITNWDQGEATKTQVLAFVKTLFMENSPGMLGIDICGECATDQEDCDMAEAVKGNDEFNKQIIDMYKSYR